MLLFLCASFLAPANRQARAARLIQARLPTGSEQRRVIAFLASQDADLATDTRAGHRAVFGRLPLVPPSSWGGLMRLGIPHQWAESYGHWVGFYFAIDARCRMAGFRVYPSGVGPGAEPWRDLP